MSDFKPCPFCGSDNVIIDSVEDGGGWAVKCQDCSANGTPSYSMNADEEKHMIIDKWNTRHEAAKVAEQPVETPDFGDYVTIEQKRYGVPNEHYSHKVIRHLSSSGYVDVPVQCPATETNHDEMVEVVACICCGVDETEVRKYRLSDVRLTRPKRELGTRSHEDAQIAIKEMAESMEDYHDAKCLDWGVDQDGLAEVAFSALLKRFDIRRRGS